MEKDTMEGKIILLALDEYAIRMSGLYKSFDGSAGRFVLDLDIDVHKIKFVEGTEAKIFYTKTTGWLASKSDIDVISVHIPEDFMFNGNKMPNAIKVKDLVNLLGGNTKLVIYNVKTDNYKELWAGVVGDIDFENVPYGNEEVEHATVVKGEDVLQIHIKY